MFSTAEGPSLQYELNDWAQQTFVLNEKRRKAKNLLPYDHNLICVYTDIYSGLRMYVMGKYVQDYHPSRVFPLLYILVALVLSCGFVVLAQDQGSIRWRVLNGFSVFFAAAICIIIVSMPQPP